MFTKKLKFAPQPICRNVSEDFCCINFGGFSQGFSWRIFLGTFSDKNEKNPARKSAKKYFPHNDYAGCQHPSPDVKNPLRIRAENWLEIITLRDAKSARFKGSRTPCTEIISGIFLAKIWPKKITSRDGCVLLMITRASRNPARYNSSEICWCNDTMAIAQIDSWKHATKTARKRTATTEICNHPESFPDSYFTQSIATLLRNPSENDSSITLRACAMFAEWKAVQIGRFSMGLV